MCKVEDRLERAHKFLHLAARTFTPEEWEQVNKLREALIEEANSADCSNGIKLVAACELLAVGLDAIDEAMSNAPQGLTTIH